MFRPHLCSVLVIFLSCLSGAVAAADDGDQVRSLLSQMSAATRNLNYSGLFTFEVGGSLDTYRIDHRIDKDQEVETLQRLNGQLREITREGTADDCLSPGTRLMHELIADVSGTSDLLHHYQFEVHRQQRIAGRSAILVNLLPKNGDRYGYSLGIDEESKLPLKIGLFAPNKRYLERIQFIELQVGDALPLAVNLSEPQQSTDGQIDCTDSSESEIQGWSVGWLPEGFVFAGQRRAVTGDEMLSFTDGLASFSVFIGDIGEKPPVRQARAHLGATTLYMVRRVWRQQPYTVTVVGEVPLATAQKVVAGLNLRQ